MRALFGHSEAVASFVAAYGERVDFGECQAIGFLSPGGVLCAGFVYHDWQPEAETIEISAAATSPRWVSRGAVRLAFGYPFEQLGCQLVYVRTTPENRAVRRCMSALGGREYEIPRLLGRDRSGLLITLSVEAWEAWKGHANARAICT